MYQLIKRSVVTEVIKVSVANQVFLVRMVVMASQV